MVTGERRRGPGQKRKKTTAPPHRKRFLFNWLPVVIYCAAIFIQSSYPSPGNLPQVPFLDKIIHMALYAGLGILFFRAYLKTPRIKGGIPWVMLLSVVSAAVYGIGDEIHQHFVPYRTADAVDALSDAIGATLGIFIYRRIAVKRSSKAARL